MVRGGILYYALLLLLLSTLITGSILLISYYQNKMLIDQIRTDSTINLVDSSIKLASLYDDTMKNGSYERFKVFENDSSTVKLEVRPWGTLKIISSEASYRNFSYAKSALVGADPFTGGKTALYLADGGRGISISGSTLIRGTCYLPNKSIRSASIEGQPFSGNKLIDGEIYKSKKRLPDAKADLFTHAEFIVNNLEKKYFSTTLVDSDIKGVIKNSFSVKPILIYSSNPIVLSDCSLLGNIIIFSEASIEIDSTCNTADIIVIAPSVDIESGFNGSIQIFSDSYIDIGDRCNLLLPSFLGVSNPVSGYMGPKSVSVGKSSIVNGTITIISDKPASSILIGENSIVFGQVYCPGQITLIGDIIGALYCHSFYFQTKRAQYINHLLNSTIDPVSLSKHYIGSGTLATDSNYRIAKWLN